MRRLLLALALLALPATAQAQILFAQDGTGAFSTNLFNFDSYTSDSHVTMTRQTGICQDGTDAIRYVQVSDTVHSQYSFGHVKAVTDTVAQGDSRFYRLRLRYNGSTDFAGNSGPWYTKWQIIGADATMPTTPGGRVIFHTGVGGVDNTTPNAWASKNVDLSPPARVALNTSNNWENLQARFVSSSTSSAADGAVYLYRGTDNTSIGTPTDQETGVVINLTGGNTWTNPSIGAGGFAQTTMTSAGNISIDVCNVTYATTFDSGWNTPGGGAAPTVSTASPNSGTTAGGTSITIAGTGFVATPTVTVGAVSCTSPHFTSSTQIECTTGAHGAGAVDVVVTNPDTQTGTGTNAYTYTTPPATYYRFRFKVELLSLPVAFAAVLGLRRRRR